MGGSEREARNEEPLFSWAQHFMCNCCYSTHAKQKNMNLYTLKTQAAP